MSTLSQPASLLLALRGLSRVVFDLDGTLYDTRDFDRAALAFVASWLRTKSGLTLEALSEDLWKRRESNRHYTLMFDDVLAEFGLPADWKDECISRFRSYSGFELKTARSLKSELEMLRNGGCRLALVSNGYASIQERKLQMLDMSKLFDLCVFCDPRVPEQLKPSFWAWSQLSDWRAEHACAYVGDDAVDAAFAATGGVQFLSFTFRSTSYED